MTARSSRSPTRTTTRASGRRRPGWEPRRAPGCRSRPVSRSRARSSTRWPRGTSARSSSSWPRPGRWPAPLAVRSSAADEDGADASFAGQHLTLLNVPSVDDVSAAVREIWWSANSDSAITYRQRVGLFTRPSVGVVVQSLLDPDVAGVMFTQNPINEADERLIEASWGLGEVVVAGRVIPDSFRMDRAGAVLERTPGRQEDRDPRRGRRRHRRGDRRAGARRAAVPRRRSARAAQRARRAVRAGVRTGARHRVGVRGRAALPAAVPRGDAGGIVTAAGRAAGLRAGRSR